MPVAIIGEVLIGVGQNFGFPSLIYIPERWFSRKEKFAMLCLGSQSIFLGMGLGYILSPLIIGNDPEKISLLNLIVSILLTLPLIICIFVIKEKPDEPPNQVAAYIESQPKESLLTFFKNLWKLFLNLNFQFMQIISFEILISFLNLGLANSYSFLSAIDYFLNSTEFTPVKVGAIGLIYIAGGSTADLVFSILIYKHRDQKHALFNYCLKGLQIILIASIIIFCIFIEKMDFKTLAIVAVILGIGFQGMVPFGLEILEEIGQTDSQLISNSYAFFGSLLCVTETQLMEIPQLKYYGAYFFLLFQIPAIILLMLFYNQTLKKREFSTTITIIEQNKSNQN